MQGNKPTHKLEKHERFNDSKAELEVWYTLYEQRPRVFRGGYTWEEVMTGSADSCFPIRGDRKWAEKIAKHYKIEVPE